MKPPVNTEAAAAVWRTRRILAAMVALATSALTLFLLRTLMQPEAVGAPSGSAPDSHPFWTAAVVMAPATLASLCWCFAVQGQVPAVRQLLKCSLLGGVALGAPSFLVGFVGPMIFSPSNNMGPLYGLITGSTGFFVGTVAGTLYGWMHRPESGHS